MYQMLRVGQCIRPLMASRRIWCNSGMRFFGSDSNANHPPHDPYAKDYKKAAGVTDDKEFVRLAKENIEDIAELRLVGRTDLEEEYELRTGRSFFSKAPLTGPFGTLKKPVMVPSTLDSRIVGCMGGDSGREHDLLWMEVNAGRKHICSKCGQVFMLDNPDWKPKDEASGDAHHH